MSRRKHHADGTFQKLPFEVLSIEALNRVLVMRSEYELEFQAYQGRLAQNELEKKSLISAISSAMQQRNDADSKYQQLHDQLRPLKVSVIGKWLFSEPTVPFWGNHYRPEAQPLFDKLKCFWDRLKELEDLRFSLQQNLQNMETKREYEPKREATLRYQSQNFVFDIGAIDPERIERVIEKKENKAALDRERERNKHERVQTKLGQTKAKAAAYENKQRELAKSVRTPKALRRQLNDNPNCPYCNLVLSTEDAHADHIHPVVKGGLSTTGNMVFVCQSCNVAKGTRTLRAFLKKMGYAEAEVYERLERMGKDV